MDRDYMKRVIELANQGSGFVNPGPLSGALLVKDNRILGEGFYEAYSAQGAEIAVLSRTREDLNDADLYLNIEPFQSEAQIRESLRLILGKGIGRVLIGMRDPMPGKKLDFMKELEELGVRYEVGVLQAECEEQNEIYTYYCKNRKPFVIVKWAMTLDGKLATKTGDSKWISSDDSLKFVHQLRQRVAAILVGENTVKQDNPMLTTRLDGNKCSNPLRVIVSRYGDIPVDSKVLQVEEGVRTLIIASEHLPPEKEEIFYRKGVMVEKLKERSGKLYFPDILEVLGRRGVDSLYIEGGSSILASAFECGCVHKVYTAIAPKIIGGREAFTPVGGAGIERMRDAIMLKRVSYEIVGPDILVKGYLI